MAEKLQIIVDNTNVHYVSILLNLPVMNYDIVSKVKPRNCTYILVSSHYNYNIMHVLYLHHHSGGSHL